MRENCIIGPSAAPTAYQLARQADFPAFTVGGRTLVSVQGLVQWVAEQAHQEGGGE